mmetsp:Transcript_6231/g.16937  ORF Transcript_6231/g.16937 Transcript_6231/m.16937 type:complete len:84 (+) Transcript_6231:501-752(+)
MIRLRLPVGFSMARIERTVMTVCLLLCCFAVPLAADVDASGSKSKDQMTQASLPMDTIELTSKNFDVSILDGNVWLIEFYAPW